MSGLLFSAVQALHMHILAGADPAPTSTSLNPGPVAPPGLGTVGSEWISWVKYFGEVGGVLGLMACGVMMAIGRRNRSHLAGEGASGIPWVLAGLTTICLASTVVVQVMQSS